MITKAIGKVWDSFLHDHLFRNSIYLMLTTGVMGLFGFVFWTIATHVFTPAEIGLGTTIISSMTMVSFISILGFNNTFIRFLPTSNNRNDDINAGVIIVTLVSIFIGSIYILLIPYITPSLSMIHSSILYSIIFILIVIVTSLNSLADSVFVAYRKAQYNLITDGFIMSISKVVLPIFLAGAGAYGVFMASGLATTICLLAAIIILIYKFNFRPHFYINMGNVKKSMSYSFTSYLGSLLTLSPTLILPIIIINNLGAEEAGYFYLAFMVINLLYTVSGSVSQSLFAEGSYGESVLLALLKRSVFILGTIMIPAIIILVLFGPLILQLFGKSYSTGATSVIIMLAIGSPLVAAFNLGSTLLKIRQQMRSLIFVNAIYAVVICALSIYWIDGGLKWVAISWNVGNLVSAIVAFILIYWYRHLPTVTSSVK